MRARVATWMVSSILVAGAAFCIHVYASNQRLFART
jgi:hypothetical protein